MADFLTDTCTSIKIEVFSYLNDHSRVRVFLISTLACKILLERDRTHTQQNHIFTKSYLIVFICRYRIMLVVNNQKIKIKIQRKAALSLLKLIFNNQ